MKKGLGLIIILITYLSCNSSVKKPIENVNVPENQIEGSWKLVYGEIRENDSVAIKDLSDTDFIKIINKSHFAFFNQKTKTGEGFYGGAGTYSLNGEDYVETLEFIGAENIRNHEFLFKVIIKEDSLIQTGLEEVEEAGIKRFIVEKYIRLGHEK